MSWRDRIDEVCLPWRGTPHSYGSACRGRGVDCVRLVDAVLSELRRIEYEDGIDRVSPNAALNDPRVFRSVIRYLMRRHPSDRVIDPTARTVEPGDIIVMREGPQNPSHVAIAGTRPGTAWHATRGAGVAVTGLGAWWRYVYVTYRVRDRETW